MKAYKGFTKDLKCRNFQFEEGKIYEENEAKLCEKGFHACEDPIDCFSYYSPSDSVYHEVELEDVADEKEVDSKRVGKKIKIGARLSVANICELHFKYIKEKSDNVKDNTGYRSAASNTGDRSAASNTGYCSAASNTGDRSAASNTGYRSAASNTGYYSAASNTGYRSAASNTGNYSAASNTGNYSAASNTGNYSAASNTGYRSAASNTGDRSAASNTGNYSAASNTGNYSAASVSGKGSVAIVTGCRSRAKANIGSAIVICERDDNYNLINIKAAIVDGAEIKADTWYTLENGVFVEKEEK